MTKLVSFPSGEAGEDLDWFATAALFDEVAAFVLRHVTDEHAQRAVTAGAASGYVFLGDLPEPDQTNVLTALRDEFPGHVDFVIYPPEVASRMDDAEVFVARAKSLARTASRSIALRDASGAVSEGKDRGIPRRFTEFGFGASWVMGFFHQDWTYDGPTAADVVAKHLAVEADEVVLAVRRDARTLLDNLPSETLEVLWTAGAQYMASFEGTSGAEWTRTVIGLCDARLAGKADVCPLTGADTEDGWACRDAVVAEIETAEFLAAEVREALVDCARHCTPDLAFRVLLSTVVNDASHRSLSPEQYTRMESIGSALLYGEFVVDSVEFLVEREPPPPVTTRPPADN
ncbi:contact-dependent growth inhibition system immunity protein [Streptomyces sp. NPDC088253]|uniref:contact-dependent growth inhibition system immunity protein n=1 Tax=Streptomyces sp. NPDC088253 TaxID=3365846 RepID=UPI00381FBB4A